MKKTIKRIVSLLCMLCLLASVWLPLLPSAPAERAKAVPASVSDEITVTDGNRYVVTVGYDTDAGIPEGAALRVSELTEADEGYGDLLARSAEALGAEEESIQFARALDISLYDPATGEEYQPAGSVSVSITLPDAALEESGSVSVVHFGEEPEVLPASVSENAVAFETEGFSVYVVIAHEGGDPVETPRVEFHYIDPNYTEVSAGVFNAPPYRFPNKNNEDQITQILTDGEDLEMITNPPNKRDSEGKEASFFYGWYTVELRGAGDTTSWDGDNHQWTGTITYTWPSPQKVEDETPISITDDGSPAVGESVTWSIGSASGTAVLDAEGTAHVYLVPVYEDFFFVNFHMGNKEAEAGLRNNLLIRRLVVFGSNDTAVARIGDISGPSPDPAHQIFAGWETVKDTDQDGVLERDRYFQTLGNNGEEITRTLDLNDQEIASAGPGYYVTVTKVGAATNHLDLYPVFAEARWLYYNLGVSGNGAVYVSSAYKLSNDEGNGTYFDKLDVSSRPGYEFGGWYMDAVMNGSDIANLSGPYDQVIVSENEDHSVTTTVTTHYPQAFQLTNDRGEFVDAVKGKAFYAKKSEYGVSIPGGSSTDVTVEQTVHTYKADIGALPSDPLDSGDEWLKLFEITSEGKLYCYKDLDELNVCAKWDPQIVDYTVVYWLENANDDDYTLMYYKTMSGIAGQQTAAEGTQPADTAIREENGVNVTYNPYDVYKLKFAHLSADQDKEKKGTQSGIQQDAIAGDGSTVINIYYDRNVYTLRFDIGFARRTSTSGSTTYYAPISPEDAAAYTGTLYGVVDGSRVELTPDGEGGYTYAGARTIRNAYEGERYKITTGNGAPQYGVIDSEVVTLSGGLSITRASGYRYQVSANDNDNNPEKYGIFNGEINRVYWNYNAFRQTNVWNGTQYSGTVFTRNSADNAGTAYSGDFYFLGEGQFTTEGTGTTYGYANESYFPLDVSPDFTYSNDLAYPSANPRYLRVDNGDADASYALGFQNGAMLSLKHDAAGWYYETTEPAVLPYTGIFYRLETVSGTWEYSVSATTAPNYAAADNWDNFLTNNQRRDLGTSCPFDAPEYTGTYEQTVNGTLFRIFYYDITDKYGATILDRYPGSQPKRVNGNNQYLFVGWLAQRDSYYNGRLSTSIKGYFDTMTEDLILTKGTVPNYNTKIQNIDPDDYTALTIEQDNDYLEGLGIPEHEGITQEFRCRYTSLNGAKKYLYRIYLADVDTQQYPAEPTAKFVITGGSGSNPDIQTPPTYYGYSRVDTKILSSNGTENTPTGSNYAEYAIPELTEAGVGNGSIMVFRFQPNDHTIDYKYGAGSPTDLISTKFGPTVHYRYGQSLAAANIYQDQAVASTPVGYSFSGWYTNPDGVGSTFDFDSKMPDGNIILYAVYKPIRFQVRIDPNGAEIDHIDHTGAAYTDGYGGYHFDSFPPFNRSDNGERPADSGYNRSQSTYFNGTYNEMVGEYAVSRNHVPISESAAEVHKANGGRLYYYLNMQYKETDGKSLPSDLRNALYVDVTDGTGQYIGGDSANGTTELYRFYEFFHTDTSTNMALTPGSFTGMTAQNMSFEAWKALYVQKEDPDDPNSPPQLFRKCNNKETWVFLGWFKDDDTMPYDFTEPVKGSFTLTAKWRLDGGYRVQYTPEYLLGDDLINGSMTSWIDPDTGAEVMSYTDGAATTVYKQPTFLTRNGSAVEDDSLVFRGWQVVNASVDPNGDPVYTAAYPGVYYDPGDDFTIHVKDADTESIIHMQAVYENKSESYRRPEVMKITLDANSGYLVDSEGNELQADAPLPWSGIGTATAYESSEQIRFYYDQSGDALHLKDYAVDPNYFKHPQKYFLLGFDEGKTEGDFIATYTADAIVSLRRIENETIYAVWEPMVYMSFVNSTDGPVTFGLSSSEPPSAVDHPLTVINVKKSMYDRVPLSDLSNITLASGEDIALAFPYGAEKTIRISGTNELGPGKVLYWDTKLTEDGTGTVYDTSSGGSATGITYTCENGDTHLLAKGGDVDNNQPFDFNEKLLVNRLGLTVTFTNLERERTLVFDDNYSGGQTQEFYYTEVDLPTATATVPATSNRFGFELQGWSLDPSATTPQYHFGDIIEHLDTLFGDERVKRIYAIWAAPSDPNTVYIYKTVPEPGNPDREFTFTVTVSGKLTKENDSTTYSDLSDTGTFILHGGEYAKLVAGEFIGDSGSKGYLRSTISVYDRNGTEDPGRGKILGQEASFQGKGSFSATEHFTVTESPVTYYTPSAELLAVSANHSISLPGGGTVEWGDPSTGGSVMYTNTITTFDVTVDKTLHSDTGAAQAFDFTAKYVLDGAEKDLGSFVVTSGIPNAEALKEIPAGATLTVTEAGDDRYITKNKLDGGAGFTESNTVSFDLDRDRTVYFDNTLKSYPVRMIKTDQDGNPGVLEAFFKLDAKSYNLGTDMFADDDHVGKFYEGTLYVGTYTLTETYHDPAYVGLDGPATITVSGSDASPFTFSDPKLSAEYDGTNHVWIIRVRNQATKKITIRKALSDPLLSSRQFSFSYSYQFNGNTVSDTFDLRPGVSGREAFELTVPVGATAFTVTETGDSAYDTTYGIDGGSPSSGTSCTISAVTKDQTILFTNTRKTFDVTVKKAAEESLAGIDFGFTASLQYGGAVPDYDENGFTDGAVSFTLQREGETVLKVPYGVRLILEEEESADGSYLLSGIASAAYPDDADSEEYSYTIASVTQDGTVVFTNASAGVDIKFLKIDGFGNPLPGATFTLYTDPDCSAEYKKNGVDPETGVSDGNGIVSFEKIPNNVYYLKETPAYPTDSDGVTWSTGNTYILLVGDAALAKTESVIGSAAAGCLENITAGASGDVSAQQALYQARFGDATHDFTRYAIFQIDSTTGKAVTEPDIAAFGILNVAEATRRVILRKTDKQSGGKLQMLQGAHFRVFRPDLSEVGPRSGLDFQSLSSGVWFSDELPYGKYYLVETVAPGTPAGYGGNAGRVFVLQVMKDGFFDGGGLAVKQLGSSNTVSGSTEEAIISAFMEWRRNSVTTP